MSKKSLNNKNLWDWVDSDFQFGDIGLDSYLSDIVELMGSSEYLSLTPPLESARLSGIMENLSLTMPRKYFLEIQYCTKAYASIFGSLFPSLIQNVDQLAYIEWLLYTEPGDPGYRDHLVHMFKVAFTCSQLIDDNGFLKKTISTQFESNHFLEWCDKHELLVAHMAPETKELIVRIALFISAIFHDFGYGYHFHSKYRNRLFKLYEWLLPDVNPFDTNSLSSGYFLQSLPSEFIKKNHAWLRNNNSKNDAEVVAGFYRDNLRLNHSVASSLFIVDLAENLLKVGALSQELYIAFQLAAEASMLHDMTDTDNDNWLYFKKKTDSDHFINSNNHKDIPLAVLLILADELSIWDRPRLQIKSEGNDAVMYSFSSENKPNEVELTFSKSQKKPWIRIKEKHQDLVMPTELYAINCLKNKNRKKNKYSILGYNLRSD